MILGSAGEKIAEKLLKKEGYRILERNYRCRYGEIDIIALDGDTIVFVEVKTRRNTAFGVPQQSVNPRKQRHMTLAATWYLTENRLNNRSARFDVVSIITQDENISTELIRNAFTADPD